MEFFNKTGHMAHVPTKAFGTQNVACLPILGLGPEDQKGVHGTQKWVLGPKWVHGTKDEKLLLDNKSFGPKFLKNRDSTKNRQIYRTFEKI